MIAAARCQSCNWQRGFLDLAPVIQRFARIAFRHLDPASRQEAVAEAIAAALVAYRRLFELGRQDEMTVVKRKAGSVAGILATLLLTVLGSKADAKTIIVSTNPDAVYSASKQYEPVANAFDCQGAR
jgi:hypothetical protein